MVGETVFLAGLALALVKPVLSVPIWQVDVPDCQARDAKRSEQ